MNQLKTAVIMAGGMGTRLASITGELPKAMVNIKGTARENYGLAKDTILEHQIGCLSENGISDFILVVGNKKEFIKNAFSSEIMQKTFPGRNINIKFFEEPAPLGTAGAFCLNELRDMIKDENFLFTYSDVLFDVNVQQMNHLHCNEQADATILISPCAQPDDRPLCVCENGKNEIINLIPKQQKNQGPRESIFPNTPKNGLMILNTSFFDLLPTCPTQLDMEQDILSTMIQSHYYKVCAWNTPCYIKDIGTVDRFYEGVNDLKNGLPQIKNPAKTYQSCVIFRESDLIEFDNDGNPSINLDASEAIKKLNNNGVISILQKDEDAFKVNPDEDMIIDTLLVRQGNGAFVNFKFEQDEFDKLFEAMNDWNIPSENAYCVENNEQFNSILVSNIGNNDQYFSANMNFAIKNVISDINSQSFATYYSAVEQ